MEGTVAITNQPSIQKFLGEGSLSHEKSVKSAEIALASVFAEHNIAFNAADHVISAIKRVFPDSKIAKDVQMKRTKMTAVVNNVTGESYKENLANILRQRKFSVLSDESTDIAAVKTSCVMVRFYDEKALKITSKFWELCQVFRPQDFKTANEGATEEKLFNSIIQAFKAQNIPIKNIVGFGSDGCNVMMGCKNSVASRLKDECPGIVIMKCICHSAHLCASEACRTLPRRCEDLARNTHNFMKCSSKRQAQLLQFQAFLDLKQHKMLHPSQTRWLSLAAVVSRILQQWEALKLYRCVLLRKLCQLRRYNGITEVLQ